jgi:hypothetical protein
VSDKVEVLAHWARAIASSPPAQPLPMRLCLASARLLDADGAAITLAYTQAERVTLCVTDDISARLEDLQDVLGQGPGLDAYRSGEMVVAPLGESAGRRWPEFAGSARAAAGPVTMYAIPICPHGQILGVLTLYQAEPRPLRYDVAETLLVTSALGVALLRDPGSQTELAPGPWASRAQVHQATGIVVAQLGAGPDDALALLRAHAFAHDTSLNAIAAQVITRQLDFATTDPSPDSNGNETS